MGCPSGAKLPNIQTSYVGNKIAVFVLQALGCDVAALNTVQFSLFPFRPFAGPDLQLTLHRQPHGVPAVQGYQGHRSGNHRSL